MEVGGGGFPAALLRDLLGLTILEGIDPFPAGRQPGAGEIFGPPLAAVSAA